MNQEEFFKRYVENIKAQKIRGGNVPMPTAIEQILEKAKEVKKCERCGVLTANPVPTISAPNERIFICRPCALAH